MTTQEMNQRLGNLFLMESQLGEEYQQVAVQENGKVPARLEEIVRELEGVTDEQARLMIQLWQGRIE